ncbi:MAG TPA: SAF domain-containing protein [Acidimicrobiales bacterium]|nr:SAF domain-containing protein [Acidimicrobiales bacterium]
MPEVPSSLKDTEMSDLADLGRQHAPRGAPSNGSGGPSTRQVRRRRALPGSRAVVGGFLVAASAVGVFAAYTASSAGPATSYVVVVNDIVAGQRLQVSDLALVALDLPPAQQGVSFADLGLLVDATALGPLSAGQLVQVSDVARPAGGADRAQISISVRAGSALGGSRTYLGAGELVDVIVTYTTGGSPETFTVSRGAIVVDVLAGSDAVGGSGAVTVVLAVPPDELEAVAQAAAAGDVTLARTTGLAGGSAPPPADAERTTSDSPAGGASPGEG